MMTLDTVNLMWLFMLLVVWCAVALMGIMLIGKHPTRVICIDDGQYENPYFSQTREDVRRLFARRRTILTAKYLYRGVFEWEENGVYYQAKQPQIMRNKCTAGREYIAFVKPGGSVILLSNIIVSVVIAIFVTIVFFVA